VQLTAGIWVFGGLKLYWRVRQPIIISAYRAQSESWIDYYNPPTLAVALGNLLVQVTDFSGHITLDTFVWLGIWDKKGPVFNFNYAGLCEWRPKTLAEKGEWIHSQERGRSFIASFCIDEIYLVAGEWWKPGELRHCSECFTVLGSLLWMVSG
jgi:hypothetical protein